MMQWQEKELIDMTAWMHGVYVLDAIGASFADKKHPYNYPSYPKLIETLNEALAEKRREAELIKMRDSFLAVSKHMEHPMDEKIEMLRERDE